MGETVNPECLDVVTGKQLRWDVVLKRLAYVPAGKGCMQCFNRNT